MHVLSCIVLLSLITGLHHSNTPQHLLNPLTTGAAAKQFMCVCVCVCVRERERKREIFKFVSTLYSTCT